MTTFGPVQRFSDARVTVRWLLGAVVPIVVAIILVALLTPKPEPSLALTLAGLAALGGVLVLVFYRGRIPLVPGATP
ncbi:MAG: hypothetical protein ACREDE_08850 [Thermoplasmata archaeon]